MKIKKVEEYQVGTPGNFKSVTNLAEAREIKNKNNDYIIIQKALVTDWGTLCGGRLVTYERWVDVG